MKQRGGGGLEGSEGPLAARLCVFLFGFTTARRFNLVLEPHTKVAIESGVEVQVQDLQPATHGGLCLFFFLCVHTAHHKDDLAFRPIAECHSYKAPPRKR